MKNKNTDTKKRKVIRDGELDLAGYKIPCFILEDGTRILSSRGMQDALKIVDESSKFERGPRLKYFLAQKSLKPFIDKEKRGGLFWTNYLLQRKNWNSCLWSNPITKYMHHFVRVRERIDEARKKTSTEASNSC